MRDEYGLLEKARAAKLEIFTDAGQAEHYADERALGVMLSQTLEWDCRRIFEAVYAALEDANMHSENRLLVEAARKSGVIGADESY